MTVLLSSALFLFAACYTIVALNPWMFSVIFPDEFVHSVIEGHLLRSHAIGFGSALLALIISLWALFTVRQNRLVVGGKKTLFLIAILSFACMIVLTVKSFEIVKPLLSNMVITERNDITKDFLHK